MFKEQVTNLQRHRAVGSPRNLALPWWQALQSSHCRVKSGVKIWCKFLGVKIHGFCFTLPQKFFQRALSRRPSGTGWGNGYGARENTALVAVEQVLGRNTRWLARKSENREKVSLWNSLFSGHPRIIRIPKSKHLCPAQNFDPYIRSKIVAYK